MKTCSTTRNLPATLAWTVRYIHISLIELVEYKCLFYGNIQMLFILIADIQQFTVAGKPVVHVAISATGQQ